ncbi:MAG: guaD, partial [Chlamydiia bacterium]|nr:guaD [Chlamydiia bacterium]
DFQDVDILEEIRKEPSKRRISFTEIMRDEAVAVWKEFQAMPGHVHY